MQKVILSLPFFEELKSDVLSISDSLSLVCIDLDGQK